MTAAEDLHSPWSPNEVARPRTAKPGIRPTTPSSGLPADPTDPSTCSRPSLFGINSNSSPTSSPYSASRQQRPQTALPGTSGGGAGEDISSPGSSKNSRRPDYRQASSITLQARNLLVSTAPSSVSSNPTPTALSPVGHGARRGGTIAGGSAAVAHPTSAGLRRSAPGPVGGSGANPMYPLAGRPASPLLSPQPHPHSRPHPQPHPLSQSEAGLYAAQMMAVTEQLVRVQDEIYRGSISPSPSGHRPGVGGGVQGRVSSGGAVGVSQQSRQLRVSDTHRLGHQLEGPQGHGHVAFGANSGSSAAPQPSVASMQQRLQGKFGEEAAAFMLHDLQRVPAHLHVLFYTIIHQLRELPSPLPATLGEAYHAVFSQHYARTVTTAERRYAQYKAQMAAAASQAAAQLAALAQKVAALTPSGTRQTPLQQQAQQQLQQQQRQLQAQQTARQAEADALAAQVAKARELHAQVMKLLCVLVAAQEPLTRTQLAGMGLDVVLPHLPAWEVLFRMEPPPGALHFAAGNFATSQRMSSNGTHGRVSTNGRMSVNGSGGAGAAATAAAAAALPMSTLSVVDPSLQQWLVDAKEAGVFVCDPRVGHAVMGQHYRQLILAVVEAQYGGQGQGGRAVQQQQRPLDGYGLRYVVLHLLLSEKEITGGERLLMDADYLEQVFRAHQEGSMYLSLVRLQSKTEIVSEGLRWLRHNMGALRSHPRAVLPLWQAAPHRTLTARLVSASGSGPPPPPPTDNSQTDPVGVPSVTSMPSATDLVGVGPSGGADGADYGPNTPRDSSEATFTSPRPSAAAVSRRAGRPQCTSLNPPPFWPAGITQLPGHAGGVTGIVFDRANRLLLASTATGSINAWDHATARRVGTMAGYSPIVPATDLHASGELLAVGSSTDSTIRIRAIKSGSGPLVTFDEPAHGGGAAAAESDDEDSSVVMTLRGPTAGSAYGAQIPTVRQVSYSPDGHLLAAVYSDGSVAVWDWAEGVRSSTMPLMGKATAVRHASFAPDGQILALACANGTIRSWHLKHVDPLHIAVLRAYDASVPVKFVQYSPSGLLLATVGEGGAEVTLWDVASGVRQQVLTGQPSCAPVRALAFSPSGLLLAVAGDDGDVCVWNTNTRGQWTQTACLRGHAYAVNALAFSPCGQVLASGGNEDTVRLWDVGAVLHRTEALRADAGHSAATGGALPLPAGAVIRDDEATSSGRQPAPGVISCLAHSPNGGQLATGMADGSVCVWDTAAPQRWARLKGEHHRPVGRVLFSADASHLASASDDGVICIWSCPRPPPPTPAASSPVPGARTTALSSGSSKSLMGSRSTSSILAAAAPPQPPPHPDLTQLLVTIQVDAQLHDPNDADGAQTGTKAPPTPGSRGGGGRCGACVGAGGWVTLACSMAFSPDGRLLASAHDNGTVLLWALPSGILAARLRSHSMLAYGLVFSPPPPRANSAPTHGLDLGYSPSLLASSSDDGTICIWDPAAAVREAEGERRPVPLVVLRHADHVYGVDFAPDGSAVATISRDGTLSTWDPRVGTRRACAQHGHSTLSKASVDGVRYSPTGLLLATGSADGSAVRLWHAGSCALLREVSGLRLLAWPGVGPVPWAAVCRLDYAPFVVRLPERALMLEAAAGLPGGSLDSQDIAAAAADEAAEGLAVASIGILQPAQAASAVARRQEQLQRCRALSFPTPPPPHPSDRASYDGEGPGGGEQHPVPLLPEYAASPLRPAVRIFSSVRSVPHVSLRGRSLVLADNGAAVFYNVAV